MDKTQITLALLQILISGITGLTAAGIGAFVGIRKLRTEMDTLKIQNQQIKREFHELEQAPARDLQIRLIGDDQPLNESYAANLAAEHLPDSNYDNVTIIKLSNAGHHTLTNITASIGANRPVGWVKGQRPIDRAVDNPDSDLDLGPGNEVILYFDFPDSYEQREKFLAAFTDHHQYRWKKYYSQRIEHETPKTTSQTNHWTSTAWTSTLIAVALILTALTTWGGYQLITWITAT